MTIKGGTTVVLVPHRSPAGSFHGVNFQAACTQWDVTGWTGTIKATAPASVCYSTSITAQISGR